MDFTTKRNLPLIYTLATFICLMTLKFKAYNYFFVLISLSHKYENIT